MGGIEKFDAMALDDAEGRSEQGEASTMKSASPISAIASRGVPLNMAQGLRRAGRCDPRGQPEDAADHLR